MVNSFSLDFLRIDPYEIGSIRGKLEYIHTANNESGTAYPLNERVSLLLFLPRSLGVRNARITVYEQSCKEMVGKFDAKYVETDGSVDKYKVSIKQGTLPIGLYFFMIEADGYSKIFGYRTSDEIVFATKREDLPLFQISVCISRWEFLVI